MVQRPPPFAALRALEAACRHRSYTAAALELNVTHSAVSQAIRRLEDEVGVKLFHRRGANMEPAAASLALAKAYAEASQSVARSMRHVAEASPNGLTVGASAQIARLWLNPLLAAVTQRFPSLSLRLRTESAADTEVDLQIQAIAPDAVFWGERLGDMDFGAYAGPSFLSQYPIDGPETAVVAPLLIDGDGAHWTAWFAAAGVDTDGPPKGLAFDDASGLAVDAAARGLGLTLTDGLSAADFVARGELIRVCPEIKVAGPTLWAVWRREHPKAGLIEPVAKCLAEMLQQRFAAGAPG